MKNSALQKRLLVIWHKHGLLISVLMILAVGAAASNALLPASIMETRETSQRIQADRDKNIVTSCASAGTMFEGMFDPNAVKAQYVQMAAAAFKERETFLEKPSLWKCNAETFDQMMPSSPMLNAVAGGLPSWSGPVTFSTFSSIMMEYQRIYECKLTELQYQADTIVYRYGTDEEDPAPAKDVFDAVPRIEKLISELDAERARSRIAMERSILSMRSYELAAPFTVEMHCLQRETVDVRIGLSLLSDAVSCLPKIWDITTSLHDRDSE